MSLSDTGKGAMRFRGYTNAHGLSSSGVGSMAEDRDGNLWLGAESGAMKIGHNGFTTYDEADGLGATRIGTLLINRAGELCAIGASENRRIIHRFDGRRFEAVELRLPGGITSWGWGWHQTMFQARLGERQGEWWMPTGQGLVRYPPLDRLAQLAHARPRAIYTERDGLAGKELFRAYEDSRGDVWISTISTARDTLTRWERRTETFHRFTAQDGLPQYNAPTAFGEDAAGNLWIGFYSGGLARYAGGRFTMFAGADGLPAGMIRGIYLDHASRLWVATGEGGVARIDDPAAERPRFGAYNTANGLSSNQATAITEDRWGRIYIGTGRGLDRLDPASGHIRHYTYRVAQLIALERVRTRIATDLHDDIGASLSRVAILSEVVKQTGSLNLRTSQALTQIADSARGLVDSMSDIVWSVDPRRDDLKNVALRVREFAADTLETRGIRWDFTVPPEMERIKLTPEQRRHLFLIFKEAVNNIARHADCANAALSVSVTRRLLLAEIRDDGRGLACDPQRDPGANERGGNGLRNMQARAAELGGELEIASTPGQGTRLMLTIPLP